MTRTIGIGIQNFEQIISNRYFYIDKTSFIKKWWENGDAVTLIARPRRFGKTLAMDMTRRFFLWNTPDRLCCFMAFLMYSRSLFVPDFVR